MCNHYLQCNDTILNNTKYKLSLKSVVVVLCHAWSRGITNGYKVAMDGLGSIHNLQALSCKGRCHLKEELAWVTDNQFLL